MYLHKSWVIINVDLKPLDIKRFGEWNSRSWSRKYGLILDKIPELIYLM